MSQLSEITNPIVKDIVRTLFLDGPRRYMDLPRDGRGEAVDLGLVYVVSEWTTLNDVGVELAVEMGLDRVKLKRKPHEVTI